MQQDLKQFILEHGAFWKEEQRELVEQKHDISNLLITVQTVDKDKEDVTVSYQYDFKEKLFEAKKLAGSDRIEKKIPEKDFRKYVESTRFTIIGAETC